MSFVQPAEAHPLTLEQTAAAYELHLVARGNYSGTWDTLADRFAEDASYYDVFYGWMYGREAIREFLRNAMKGIEDWSFPVQWHVVAQGRVVAHWLNRLPGRRPDGSYYEFPGLSAITYGPDGLIRQQMDIYDGRAAIRVVLSSKLGFFGRALRFCFGWLAPVGREGVRLIYRVFDRSRK
jgi:hypothetical protein